jgi:transcriptional regulator with XRE-family HTH domain
MNGLKHARKAVNLRRKDVSAALNISNEAICMWENKKRFPKTALLPKLAKLYHCSVDELLQEYDDDAIIDPQPTTTNAE